MGKRRVLSVRQKFSKHLNMKIQLISANILAAVAALGLMAGCAETSGNSAAVSQKESILRQAGFKTKTVTNAQAQQELAKLPAERVSMAKFKGVVYYVYPTATKNQILVGKKPQYLAYKNIMIQNQKKQMAAAPAAATQGQTAAAAEAANPNAAIPVMQLDPDPRGVAVQVYDGMGPMDDGSSW